MYDKITAREGYDGNTPTLTIRSGGKIIACFRGDSLHFADKITKNDCTFLLALAKLEFLKE